MSEISLLTSTAARADSACPRRPLTRSPTFLAVLPVAVSLAVAADLARAQEEAPLEEITITGSRIQRDSFSTPTPVTAISADQLQAMAPGSLIEAFDQVPQFLNNESPTTQFNFAGAAGASNLNLRGIGSNRTLVLLDGRRVVSANRLGTVDINLFPEAMIERVEVVTGGASAAYGSDAVAGVTNFLLDTDFVGFNGRGQAGVTSRGDAQSQEISLAFGQELGQRAHIIASAEYFEQDGIDAYPERDWYQGWGTVTNPAWVASGTDPRLIVAPNVVSTQYTFGGLILQRGSALHRLMFEPDGSVSPFVQSDLSVFDTGTQSQSVAPQFGGGSGDNVEADRGGQGGLVPSILRNNAFTYVDYDVSDNVTLYLQGLYGRSQTEGVGNSPVLFGTWQGRIFRDNAFLPQTVRDVMAAEGLESFGFSRMHSTADIARGRMEQENETTSFTGGFEAEIPAGMFGGWSVNGYYQYGKNENRIDLIDFIRTDRLAVAMDAVVNPATGNVVCRATLFDNPRYEGCVPLNLLGEGRASEAAIDYVLGPDKTISADIRQRFAEISANGEVWEGWGAGAVSAAIGASYRKDSLDQVVGPADLMALSTPRNDPSIGIQGIPVGFAGSESVFQFSTAPNIRGSYNVKEYFAEALVPLLSAAPFADQLDLSLAGRWADYSGSGGIWAYKAGLDWQVIPDLRLRGTWSRDVRAANLSERFDAQGQGASAEDPLFNNQQFSFGQTIGGNPNVNPEEADTVTFGLVYQPGYLPGLNLAVDYYEIDVAGAIGQLGVQRIIDDCFAGAQSLCAQITRDPQTNIITNVQNVFLNINAARVSGIDWEASYTADVDFFGQGGENLNVRLLGSWLEENSTTNLGAPPVDNAGETGQAGLPEWKWTLGLTYLNGPFRAYVQERYIGEGNLNNDWVEGVDINDNTVDAAWYTDLRLSWEFPMDTAGAVEVFGNVTNLFDEDPPISAGFFSFFGATQVNEALFDVLGRRYTAGFRYTY